MSRVIVSVVILFGLFGWVVRAQTPQRDAQNSPVVRLGFGGLVVGDSTAYDLEQHFGLKHDIDSRFKEEVPTDAEISALGHDPHPGDLDFWMKVDNLEFLPGVTCPRAYIRLHDGICVVIHTRFKTPKLALVARHFNMRFAQEGVSLSSTKGGLAWTGLDSTAVLLPDQPDGYHHLKITHQLFADGTR